ncbi:MAG: hypothetical protein AAGG02_14870 [Cyanobacteria bacterium P01_H01_bin.15]
MSEQLEIFPVDGDVIRVLPEASTSFKTVRGGPKLIRDGDRVFLQMGIENEPSSHSAQFEVSARRLEVSEFAEDDIELLRSQIEALDIELCKTKGLKKGLESINDGRFRRLLVTLLNFLNPAQIALLFCLYKMAYEQESSPKVSFESNELMDKLGYVRSSSGYFNSKSRSNLHRDLLALHRMELVLARQLSNSRTRYDIKTLLRIESYEVDRKPRAFDAEKAGDYTFELADQYTLTLGFLRDAVDEDPDKILLAYSTDKLRSRGKGQKNENDYATKLLAYLASRMKWDKLIEGEYLEISVRYLMKNLGIFSANNTRNHNHLKGAIEKLTEAGYLKDYKEILNKKNKPQKIRFRINLQMIRSL